MTKINELDTKRIEVQGAVGNREVVKGGKRTVGEQLVEWVDSIMPSRF